MNRWLLFGLLLATVAALALRLPQLSERPMHNDEAVNADKFRSLWESGSYRYDPNEHHGPTLPYATLVAGWISRAASHSPLNDTLLRLVPVAFGIGLILLLPLLADGLGRAATFCAALLTALSPAMVYFSRYYIHEMLLVFFTLIMLAGGWRYAQKPHIGWLIMVGAGLGLMAATKETFVIELAAMGAAGVSTVVWAKREDGVALDWKSWLRPKILAWVTGVAVITAVLLFSSFLANASGPLDSIRSYLPWVNRAGGASPHIHPWYFYLQRLFFFHPGKGLWFTEILILALALIAFVTALIGRSLAGANTTLVRFIGFYTFALTAAYSIIAYKTPWCFLAFLHGMILLAGVGAVVIVQAPRPVWAKCGVAALLLAATTQLGWQAWRDSFPFAARRQNPHVYAHTSPDFAHLVEMVQAVARAHPQHYEMVVKVIARDDDYWPLPWSLRDFRNVGWFGKIPDDPRAPMLIVSAKLASELTARLDERYQAAGLFELRPGVFLELYVEKDLWKIFLATRPKPE
jgi:uncharacterized protein (TIGR03663 family)